MKHKIENAMVVMKFGGTSVKDFGAMSRVAEILAQNRSARTLVITSALAGVTDLLVQAVAAVREQKMRDLHRTLEVIAERHHAILKKISPQIKLHDGTAAKTELLLSSLGQTAEEFLQSGKITPADQDCILAYGELLSSTLLCAVLQQHQLPALWLEATTVLKTDNTFGKAQPDMEATRRAVQTHLLPLLQRSPLVVSQGYIGATRDGQIITLGRGGSDYSATILGAALHADRVEIWTDVDGVMTADPRLIKHARKLDYLSFNEAAELAYFGAKVLHPDTILPAMNQNIPVAVRNTHNHRQGGTTIRPQNPNDQSRVVKSIAHKTGITIINIYSTRMLMAYGFLERVFAVFSRCQTPVDLIVTSEVSVSLTIDNTARLEEIRHELETFSQVEIMSGQAIVCLVGQGLRESHGIAARTFNAIRPINPRLISRGASKINLSFTVEEKDIPETIRKLHAEYFEKEAP